MQLISQPSEQQICLIKVVVVVSESSTLAVNRAKSSSTAIEAGGEGGGGDGGGVVNPQCGDLAVGVAVFVVVAGPSQCSRSEDTRTLKQHSSGKFKRKRSFNKSFYSLSITRYHFSSKILTIAVRS